MEVVRNLSSCMVIGHMQQTLIPDLFNQRVQDQCWGWKPHLKGAREPITAPHTKHQDSLIPEATS